jgi:putative flippase GtrA
LVPKDANRLRVRFRRSSVTCPSLLRRTALGGAREGHVLVAEQLRRLPALAAALRTRLHQDDAGAQFARFVVVGGVSSALYALVFIALDGVGDQPANLAGAIASTLLANEMHRRLTFHAGEQVSWFTAQWEGGGLAGVGLVATALALAGVHALIGDIGTGAQLCLIAAVTGAIGLVRFVALRSWVFSPTSARE